MAAWRVDVLAFDGCYAAEAYAVIDLLTVASAVAAAVRPGGGDLFAPRIVSLTGRVRPSGSGELRTERAAAGADDLVVPGFACVNPASVGAWLARWDAEIAAIRAAGPVSAVCGGAFLLAEAGRLDGRAAATTAWLFAPELARRYPRVNVRSTALIVRDGDVATTGAFSAANDLALDLIRRHGGARIARATSQLTLVPDGRDSQAAFVDERLRPVHPPGFADDVKRRLRARLADPYDLDALARACHVSTRTLHRRFAAETGESPLAYLRAARVATAKRLLETADLSVAEIRTRVGYRDPAAFRELFLATTGLTPSEYRRTFAVRSRPVSQ